MTTSDDFKQELKAGNFGKALKLALSEAIELQITTWVVPTNASGLEPQSGQPGYRMRTRINIVDGDIDNEVGSQFLSNGPYTELRQFHMEQVHEGRETIQKNLQGLQKIFGLLLNVDQAQPPAPDSEAEPESDTPVPMNAYITTETVTAVPAESIPTVPTQPIIPTPPPGADVQPTAAAVASQPDLEPASISPEIFAPPATAALAPEALGDLTLPEDAPTAAIAPQPIIPTSTTALLGTGAAVVAATSLADVMANPPSATAQPETAPLAPEALSELDLASGSDASFESPAEAATLPPEDSAASLLTLDTPTTEVLGDVPAPDEIPLSSPDSAALNPADDTTGFALGSSTALTDAVEVETALNRLFPDSEASESYPPTTDLSLEAPTSTEDLTDLFAETPTDSHPLDSDPTATVEADASLSDLFDTPSEINQADVPTADLDLPAEESASFGLETALPDDIFATTGDEIPNPYATDPISNLEFEDSLTDLFTPGADELESAEEPAAFAPDATALSSLFAEPTDEFGSLDEPVEPSPAEVEALSSLFDEPTDTADAPTADLETSSPDAEAALADLFAEPEPGLTDTDTDTDEVPPALTEDALPSLVDLETPELSLTGLSSEEADADLMAALAEPEAEIAPPAVDAALIDLFSEPESTPGEEPTELGAALTLDSETADTNLADAFDSFEPPAPQIPLSELFDDPAPDVSLLFAEAPPVDPSLSVEESLAVLFKEPDATRAEPAEDLEVSQAVPEIDEEALSALFAETPDNAYSFTMVSETSEDGLEFPSLELEAADAPEAAANPFADFLSTADLSEEEEQPEAPGEPDIPTLLPPPTRKKRDQNNQKSGG